MPDRLHITVLGSGSSGGVPRIGGTDGKGDWGRCDPEESRNRRTRCSILVRRGYGREKCGPGRATQILVDTSPDMRAQLLAACCSHLDAVLYTHDHADQTHGLDDLRVLALQCGKRVPVYIDENTSGELVKRFRYCFESPPGSPYPPILEKIRMPCCGESFGIEGPGGTIPVMPFLQYHGSVNSLGFRFGGLAYSSDVVGLPEESFSVLEGVHTWIVDALQYKPHRTHAHLDRALEWISRIKPARAVLTNLHVDMDYRTLVRRLPSGVEPAYDGMILEVDILPEKYPVDRKYSG